MPKKTTAKKAARRKPAVKLAKTTAAELDDIIAAPPPRLDVTPEPVEPEVPFDDDDWNPNAPDNAMDIVHALVPEFEEKPEPEQATSPSEAQIAEHMKAIQVMATVSLPLPAPVKAVERPRPAKSPETPSKPLLPGEEEDVNNPYIIETIKQLTDAVVFLGKHAKKMQQKDKEICRLRVLRGQKVMRRLQERA